MRKAKSNKESFALHKEGNIEKDKLESVVEDNMKEYASAVIVDRAIPNIDGLKPVQRRLLYTMYKMNLFSGKHTKLNNIGGSAMVLHPHGDPSPSIYTMGAEWNNNLPYAEIEGNGGNIIQGVKAASATRYTSGSLTDAVKYMTNGLKEDAVDMIPNYDGSTKEPKLLPTEFPNVLMNATEGIAVGMSTNIIPHNPKEIMNAIIHYIDNPDDKPEAYAKIIKGPDFPTGGLLVNSKKANLRELKYGKTGKLDKNDKKAESYIVRGEANIVEDNKEPYIQFTSIPFGVTTEKLNESFNKFAEKHQTLGMTELRDETEDYNKIDIKIIFKRGTSEKRMSQALALMYKETLIENKLSPNNLIIANGHPKVVNIVDYFSEWYKFRAEFTRRRFEFRLNKYNNRLEIVNGLLKLVDQSNKIVEDAKKSNNKQDFINILVDKYDFTNNQAEAIAQIQLYRLGKQDTKSLKEEKSKLTKDIKGLEYLLNNDDAFRENIKQELINIRDTVFKDADRKTKLVNETITDNIKIDETKLIEKKDVVVVTKSNGSVQRMSQQVYDNNIDKYNDKDMIVSAQKGNTRQGFLGFTKNGLAYYRSVDELPNQNVKFEVDSVQKEIPSYKSSDETLEGYIFDLDDKVMSKLYVVSITKLGMAKVTTIDKIKPNTNTKAYFKRTTKYNGLKIKNDEVIYTKVFNEDEFNKMTLQVIRNKGKKINIKLSNMNIQGAGGSGSKKVNVKDGYEIKEIKELVD